MESATKAHLPVDAEASADVVRNGAFYTAAEIEAERFLAMAQMSRAMSHSARNAMQGGHACLQILSIKLADRPDLNEILDRVQASQDRLLDIFNELSEYCTFPQLEIEACPISELMRSAAAMAREARPDSDTDIQLHAWAADHMVRIDPRLLQRAVTRLLLDSMDAGATTITARPIHPDKRTMAADVVEISDNRPIFRENDVKNFFEPFAGRADNLGAAFAKRVIELHGGQITVDGDSTLGAKITLTLPRM